MSRALRHGRGGMVGQRPDEADLGRAEGVRPRREGAERPEHLVAGDERRHDHRADADVADDPVGVLGVGERRVGEVVAGQDDRRARRRPARTCPTPTGRSIERTHSRLRRLRIPASCAKRRWPVAGSTR